MNTEKTPSYSELLRQTSKALHQDMVNRCNKIWIYMSILSFILFIMFLIQVNSNESNDVAISNGSLITEEIYIIDKNDNPRIYLGVDDYGDPNLYMYDKQNNPRIKIGLNKYSEPILGMLDTKGNPRLTLSVYENITKLAMWDNMGRDRIYLGMYGNNKLRLHMNDEWGNTVRYMGTE